MEIQYLLVCDRNSLQVVIEFDVVKNYRHELLYLLKKNWIDIANAEYFAKQFSRKRTAFAYTEADFVYTAIAIEGSEQVQRRVLAFFKNLHLELTKLLQLGDAQSARLSLESSPELQRMLTKRFNSILLRLDAPQLQIESEDTKTNLTKDAESIVLHYESF